VEEHDRSTPFTSSGGFCVTKQSWLARHKELILMEALLGLVCLVCIVVGMKLESNHVAERLAACLNPQLMTERNELFERVVVCESTWYRDMDGDGYGDIDLHISSCLQPEGFVANALDCDDSDPSVHPGAKETRNGIDDNCDGVIDPRLPTDGAVWYIDFDGEGFGSSIKPDKSLRRIVCLQIQK
jgi:hypothetical protein